MQDASGAYKFKLGTSYGFAELSKPNANINSGDSLVISNAHINLKYLSLPVMFGYDFTRKKIQWSIYNGLSINQIVSEKVKVEYVSNNNNDVKLVNEIEGMRKTFITVNLGAEAQYPINNKMSIGLSPEIKFGINSINKNTPIKTYPINYGVSVNLHLNLK